MNDRFVILLEDLILEDDSIEQKQLPIDDDSKQALIQVRTNIFNDDVDALAEKMYTGATTLGAWEEAMRQRIRELHTSIAAIAKGGWDQMTWEDWGRLGPILKDQYKFLHGFAQHIAENRDTISLAQIQARAHLYGESAMQSFGKVIVPIAIEKQLPWLPRDGSTTCLMNCCCAWVLKKVGVEKDFNIVEAKWELSPAEHCETCIERNGHIETIRVYKTIEIPDHIGFYCEEKEYIEKGGPGSGFTSEAGHRGRPGEVGGSQSNGGKNIKNFELEHYHDTSVEWGMLIDKDGNVLQQSKGGQKRFTPKKSVLEKARGGIFTHTHPGILPMDHNDVDSAWRIGLEEVRAAAIDADGNMVLYSLRGDWPFERSVEEDPMSDAQKKAGDIIHDAYFANGGRDFYDAIKTADADWYKVKNDYKDRTEYANKVITPLRLGWLRLFLTNFAESADMEYSEQVIAKKEYVEKGGPGSGFTSEAGHRGIPGQVGGSQSGGIGNAQDVKFAGKKANPGGIDTISQYRNSDGSWTSERQILHDKIKRSFFEGKTPVDNPTSYVLGGGPASGKSSLLNSGLVDLPDNMVLASGDDIKLLLPEYERGIENSAAFVHEESSYLSKEIAKEAAVGGYNMIMDGTGDSSIEQLRAKVEAMRSSGQAVKGIYVTTSIEIAIARSLARAAATGRYIPQSVLRADHAAVSRVFPSIISNGIFDNIDLYDTTSGKAILIASGTGTTLTIIHSDAYQAFLDKAK